MLDKVLEFLKLAWFPLLLITLFVALWFIDSFVKKSLPCPVCEGTGKIWQEVPDSPDLQAENCPYCAGTGILPLSNQE